MPLSVCVCVCVYMSIYASAYACMRVCMHVYVFVCTNRHACTYKTGWHSRSRARLCEDVHTYTNMNYTRICTYVCTYRRHSRSRARRCARTYARRFCVGSRRISRPSIALGVANATLEILTGLHTQAKNKLKKKTSNFIALYRLGCCLHAFGNIDRLVRLGYFSLV
jgi:hypothetical protein